ncbi:MAG: DUF4276 family protein [Planctomycetes bacterium]|nr:DUF4276 family protein [Planctomycetota bacterium]
MNRVIAVVEGCTEQAFVREVLAPWLGSRDVGLTARLVGKPGHKGGVGEYPRAQRDMIALLKQDSVTFVTTMFDFYRMPDSWPGRKKAKKLAFARKASTVEVAILNDVAQTFGGRFDRRRFFPYVQMHEYEGLLFSRPEVISKVLMNPAIAEDLKAIRADFDAPEEIDDSPETAPSKRIDKLSPVFQKPLHGVIAAQRIGIETIREECPHFNEWLTALENIGGSR